MSLTIGLKNWMVTPDHQNIYIKSFKPNSKKTDPIISSLGLSNDTLVEIHQLLKVSNCRSIKTFKEYSNIHFKQGTWSSYSYVVYDHPVSDSIILNYQSRGIQFIRDNVKIGYSGAL